MTAYAVFTRHSTTDQAEMDIYAQMAPPAGVGHPLTPLALYGEIETLEGQPLEGAVILSFPTAAEARAWYDSPAYQAAHLHRLKGSTYTVFIIEGVDTPAA